MQCVYIGCSGYTRARNPDEVANNMIAGVSKDQDYKNANVVDIYIDIIKVLTASQPGDHRASMHQPLGSCSSSRKSDLQVAGHYAPVICVVLIALYWVICCKPSITLRCR